MAQTIDINNREGLRKVLHEINFDDYKSSKGFSDLIEEDKKKGTKYREGMTEDELLDVIQYLRSDSGRGGKTRLEYLSEYKKTPYQREAAHKAYMEQMLVEKRRSEVEDARVEYGLPNEVRNVFMEEKTPVQPQKRSLEDIKSAYIKEMEALTKKFQDEINSLG